MQRILAVLALLLALEATAHAADEERPVRVRAELGVIPLLSITGDPNLQVLLGAELVPLRLTLLLKAQLGQRLSDVGAASIFEDGDDLRVRWRGETAFVARFRPFASLGLELQGGAGRESFELEPKDRPALPSVVPTAFATAGLGWVLHLVAGVYARPGASVVFLLSEGQRTVGTETTHLRWGFLSPELFVGVQF